MFDSEFEDTTLWGYASPRVLRKCKKALTETRTISNCVFKYVRRSVCEYYL